MKILAVTMKLTKIAFSGTRPIGKMSKKLNNYSVSFKQSINASQLTANCLLLRLCTANNEPEDKMLIVLQHNREITSYT